MSISLCMIVKNEEYFLKSCLESIKDFVDEIIIVDTGSVDKTKEIAKTFTQLVYDFKWKDDFSLARNFSLQKATKDWILVLDADEKISERDFIRIKKLILKNDFSGFSFIQRSYSNNISKIKWNHSKNDKYTESKNFVGWRYRGITRLFYNDKRIKFIYPVHETVIESLKKNKSKIKSTNIPIHHFEELKSRKFLNNKSKYYIKLLKNKIKSFPLAKFYFELGSEFHNINNISQSKKYFKKSIELNSSFEELLINFP